MDSRWKKGRRRMIIHYHLYKNAGTSIDDFLQQAFAGRWCSFDTGATAVLAPAAAGEYLRRRPDVLALSSHGLRPPAPEGYDVFPIVLVRHPLDRARSVYSHVRRDRSESETSLAAQHHDFGGFVRWCLDYPEKGGVVITNYQVIHFSSASFDVPHIFEARVTEKHLQESVALMASLPCVGIVDEFSEYFARLKTALGEWLTVPVTGCETRANASVERPELKLKKRLDTLRDELSPKLLARFIEENSLDYRLYGSVAFLAGKQREQKKRFEMAQGE
jgi:hypothetical protein